MIEFHHPTIADIEWLKPILDKEQTMSCEYALGNLVGWSTHYNTEIANVDGTLLTKICNNNLFGFPKGENRKKVIEYLNENYDYLSFYGLVESEKQYLEELFPGKFNFYPSRNSFDYIYKVSDLASLTGKKYHSKRNHISYFKKNFNWSYEEITKENLPECMMMNEKWYLMNIDKDPHGIEAEKAVLQLAFDNYERFNFKGGILRVDGEVVAFTFGEELNKTMFVTHFEKAFSDVRGAYPMINMLFALNTICDYELVNREDDIGSEGLRKAKLSYYPEFLLEKFTAVRI